jgi:hypothetical protein
MRRAGAWQPLNAGGGVLGYAQVTTVQSPIGTSDTLITGLTLTVPVGASRRIKVTGKTILSPNAGAIVRGMIFADGVEVNRGTITLQNGEFGTFHVEAILSPTAASHTYAMYAATNTGQISSQAAATFPAFILVEDIGPV